MGLVEIHRVFCQEVVETKLDTNRHKWRIRFMYFTRAGHGLQNFTMSSDWIAAPYQHVVIGKMRSYQFQGQY